MKSSSAKSTLKRIVWAVDPLEASPDAIRAAAKTIQALAGKSSLQVFPLYVWGASAPQKIPKPGAWNSAGMREFARSRFEDALAKTSVAGLRKLEMSPVPAGGMREGVSRLLEFAREKKAGLIVVATHGKKLLQRWTLGSFAETLILSADIPVLTVHPDGRTATAFQDILFPTDFSESSRMAFNRVLDFASGQGSRVVLFHRVQMPSYSAFQPAFSNFDFMGEALAAERSEKRALAESWARMGRKRGLKVDVLIDDSRARDVSEAILRAADRLQGVIAMPAQSGTVSAFFLGSTARNIVRRSRQPVWILHPEPKGGSRAQKLRQKSVELDNLLV